MNAAPAVRASAVGRTFGYFRAVDGIDFEARPGETVLVLGPNGAGKTTFLRMAAGLLPVTGGKLTIFGLSPGANEENVRHRIGFLSHSLALYPDLTARENLRFFARLYGIAGREIRIESLLGEVGLTEWRDEPARNFSRGMKQRLALARVFLHEPDLLLLDEPFTGLDFASATAFARRLDARRAAGAAILLASHRIETAAPLGDRVVFLRKGRVAESFGLAGVSESERVERLRSLLREAS